MPDKRLLIVHAHPDDESITTGALMAGYVRQGVQVTLVTCTLGEEGEVLLEDKQHLASHAEDKLGEHRFTELAAAMEVLGVTDWRLLGAPHKYRDSGMMGTEPNNRPDCFWRADLLEAAGDLVSVIREVRPQVAVTYDDFGGYGHPDHIQAHRVAMYASQLAAVASYRPDLGDAWDIPRIFWTAFPVSAIRAGIKALQEMGDKSDFAAMDPDNIPFAIPDEAVDAAVDVSEQLGAKIDAMKAHASQISLEQGFFSLSNNVGAPVFGTEFFRLVKGTRPAGGATLDDLFAGLDAAQ
jgi:N-acetyl-1-D-myo-inositol-2-amino-2-deoxy-alpha-D-glucopyranoside deacetylase